MQKEIERLMTILSGMDPNDPQYKVVLKNLSDLTEVREKSRLFKPDTLLQVAANLLGIMSVLHYEKIDIITSKAFGLIKK